MKHLQNIRPYQINEDQPVFLRMNQYTRQVFQAQGLKLFYFFCFKSISQNRHFRHSCQFKILRHCHHYNKVVKKQLNLIRPNFSLKNFILSSSGFFGGKQVFQEETSLLSRFKFLTKSNCTKIFRKKCAGGEKLMIFVHVVAYNNN